MKESKCIANCSCNSSRRDFLKKMGILTAGSLASSPLLGNNFISFAKEKGMIMPVIRGYGPASNYIPKIKVAFVRRKGEYGMAWPGAIYDGEASKDNYIEQLKLESKKIKVLLDIKNTPIYSSEEADIWLQEAKEDKVDGLLVMVHDRQQHAWPTAQKAAESGIPTIIFSPLGTSFTTNTENLANKFGSVTYSTNDFNQALFGLKMLKAGARMKRSRCVVIKGDD